MAHSTRWRRTKLPQHVILLLYAFVVAAQCEKGVAKAIDILANENTIILKLMRLSSISELKNFAADFIQRRLGSTVWGKIRNQTVLPS